MKALETAENLIEEGIEPDAEYVAAAGFDYGWVKVWQVEDKFVVHWGDNTNSYAVLKDDVDLDDHSLAEWLEDDSLYGLEAILHTANIRGANAVPEAEETDEGPFYVLRTRYWYGATETSDVIMNNSGREPLAFETLREARAWIERADSGVYYLAHGECARPSYKVVAA